MVAVVVDSRTRSKVKTAVASQLIQTAAERVNVLTPDELFRFLRDLPTQDDSDRRSEIRGYAVRVTNRASSDVQPRGRKVVKTVAAALNRLRS